MKQARGEIRRLLTLIGEIQDNVGKANAAIYDDRSPDAFAKCTAAVQKAHDLCIFATSKYYPLEAVNK